MPIGQLSPGPRRQYKGTARPQDKVHQQQKSFFTLSYLNYFQQMQTVIDVPVSAHCGNADCKCGDRCVTSAVVVRGTDIGTSCGCAQGQCNCK